MTTDVDWRELIDRSFDDGPTHRPVEQRLIEGRRALRRRRVVIGAAAAVLTVAAGGVAVAVAPSEPHAAMPAIDRQDEQPSVPAREAVVWKQSGWWIAPEWTVEKRIQNPMGYDEPRHSVALELVNPPDHRLVLAVYDGHGGTSVSSVPSTAGSLETWLSGAVANQRNLDGEPQPDPVAFGQGETLVAADGVTILDQLPHPDLPASFAAPDDRTAAALIKENGKQTFVLVRDTGGQVQVIPFRGDFNSLDDFLRFAVQQYDSGEGLL
ncbi:MAG TPA: hypothetical protein VKB55_10785 [Nocardioidaceae bacterium]|nr:hypothetical protein [Nocardioidaceae bacterium]